jgi:hypothetical protein
MAKVDAWMAQRAEIARELREAADRIMAGENPFRPRVTTPSMLAKEVARRGGTARRGRPPGSGRKAAAPPAGSSDAPAPQSATGRRTMSPEARERIAAAQRKRWAKVRRGNAAK